MKLVDILARELKVWPVGFKDVGQADSGYLHLPGDGQYIGHTQEEYTKADDWWTAIVTRVQWKAAVDALKDDQEKVMPVDWSKAPLATHYTPGKPEEGLNAVYWRVIEGVTVMAWAVRGNGSIAKCNSACEFNLKRTDVISRIWDGLGLPPIGTECEGMDENGEWGKCKIVHHTTQNPPRALAVFGKDNSSCSFFIAYRPLRTAEQIAAEDREKAIGDMERLTNYQITQSSARILYDYGFRKQAKS